MLHNTDCPIINEQKILNSLKRKQNNDSVLVYEILNKALELKGLNSEDVAALVAISEPNLLLELFQIAKKIKENIYGNRLVFFAPLYISNLCINNCLYCAFRIENQQLKRRTLTQDEIAEETNYLIRQGHKRILLLTGEMSNQNTLKYILEAISTIYNVKTTDGKICRININIAPLTIENFSRLKAAQIGTYQLFQETYHYDTYCKMHVAGRKADYNWHITAMNRALTAGIDDVGIGILFGLADWRFEILALLQHIEYLNQNFGIGPHTISVPRLEPAIGSTIANSPPYPVSDKDFCKIIAILRLAVPYTGIILSTRESISLRRQAFSLGVSQISAGSRTNPGGYTKQKEDIETSQFELGDHRSLDEVVADVVSLNYMPSFCTACYRKGRTGDNFMKLAKAGKIKNMCTPNAIITFKEYLIRYATSKTRKLGEQLITKEISAMSTQQKQTLQELIAKVETGAQGICI